MLEINRRAIVISDFKRNIRGLITAGAGNEYIAGFDIHNHDVRRLAGSPQRIPSPNSRQFHVR
jgi:hypothetical protein